MLRQHCHGRQSVSLRSPRGAIADAERYGRYRDAMLTPPRRRCPPGVASLYRVPPVTARPSRRLIRAISYHLMKSRRAGLRGHI